MTWLVTGGLGYIGGHLVETLLAKGEKVVIIDWSKDRKKIKFLDGAILLSEDFRNKELVSQTLRKFRVEHVVHLAALKSVEESQLNPDLYFEINTEGTRLLLEAIRSSEISSFVFASSAAVYGEKKFGIASEIDDTNPISSYGESKLWAERSVAEFLKKKGLRGSSLRLFNVVGSSRKELEDDSLVNLTSVIKQNILENKNHKIFGSDYPTYDGTCVRDYIDVRDIVEDIYLVSKSVEPIPSILNLGSGKGTSVLDIVEMMDRQASYKSETDFFPRREGDSAALIANIDLYKGFFPLRKRIELMESIRSCFSDLP
jgi:UDP-glucose 4-epimerase